ncbi:MAG: crotonyl-CoA carboxylase/reductase [Caldilineales bacterium]
MTVQADILDERKVLYEVGEQPPLGYVPPQMYAWTVRADRFGEPTKAWQVEVIDVPEPADDEVLVYVMAAGVNYNNVWAGLGVPVNVIAARNKAGEPEDFHIGGSDGSGIVYKVGKDVTDLKVGDEVVIHCGIWDRNDPVLAAGDDPMYGNSFRIWGYETNWGSFAQFTKVQAHQCVPRPQHLSWEQSAAYMLVGATAYRMLYNWGAHSLRSDDVVLVWGGAGGLGSMAIQIVKAAGGRAVAVVSEDDKFEYCQNLGAAGCINRRNFDHWGMLPHWKDTVGYNQWLKGVRQFGKAIWDVLGERVNPRLVFEHPGETTIPTSIFVCETGGMVVICAGTTGYNATVDLRYLWMRQKRLQGSHFANDDQARGINDLVIAGKVDPCMSQAFTWNELPLSHQLMYENKHPYGNMAILIGAPDFGLGVKVAAPVQQPATTLPASLPSDDTYKAPHAPLPAPSNGHATELDTRTVREIMHFGVIATGEDTPVDDAAQRMVQFHVHALVVVDPQGYLSGVLSQTDVVLARKGRSLAELAGLRARDIMTRDVVTCTPDTTVSEAIATMTRRQIHRLVVVDPSRGKSWPIGVVSMTDIITYGMGRADVGMSLPPSSVADIYEPLEPEHQLAELVEDETLVRDVMHQGVITCSRKTPLEEVARTMLANQIHAVVVTEGERAAGVVSQTDIVLAQQGRPIEKAAALTAGDVMTPGLVSCTSDRKLSDAVTLMTRNRIHRLVVVEDRAGKLAPVGILSMTDVVRRLISEN